MSHLHAASSSMPRQPLRAAAGVGVSTRILGGSTVARMPAAANGRVYGDFSGVESESEEEQLGDKKMMDDAAKRRAAKLKEIEKSRKLTKKRRSSSASDSTASERRATGDASDEEAAVAEERRARVSANSTWKTDVVTSSGARSRRASIGGETMELTSTRPGLGTVGMGASVRRFSVAGASPLQAATAQGGVRASTRNLIGTSPLQAATAQGGVRASTRNLIGSSPLQAATAQGGVRASTRNLIGGVLSPAGISSGMATTSLGAGGHTPVPAADGDAAAARRAMLAAAGGTRGSVRMLGPMTSSPATPVPAQGPVQGQPMQGYGSPLPPGSTGGQGQGEATRRPSLAPSNAMLANMAGGSRSSTRYLGPSVTPVQSVGVASTGGQMGVSPAMAAVSPGFHTGGPADSTPSRPTLASMSGGARASVRMLGPAGVTPVTPVPAPVPASPAEPAVSTSYATRRPSLAGGQAAALAAANGGMRASTRVLTVGQHGQPLSANATSVTASPHTDHGSQAMRVVSEQSPYLQGGQHVQQQQQQQYSQAGDGHPQGPIQDFKRPSLASANGGMRVSVRGVGLGVASPPPPAAVPAPMAVQGGDRVRRPSLAGNVQGGVVMQPPATVPSPRMSQPQAAVHAHPLKAPVSPRPVQAAAPLSPGRRGGGSAWDAPAPHVDAEAHRRPSLATVAHAYQGVAHVQQQQQQHHDPQHQQQQRRSSVAPAGAVNPYADLGGSDAPPVVQYTVAQGKPSPHAGLDQHRAASLAKSAAGQGVSRRGPAAFGSGASLPSTQSSATALTHTPHLPTPRVVHAPTAAAPGITPSMQPRSPWADEGAQQQQQHAQVEVSVPAPYHPRTRVVHAAAVPAAGKVHDSPASTSIDEPPSAHHHHSDEADAEGREDGPPPLNGAEYRQGVYTEARRRQADGSWPDAEPAFIVVPMTRPDGKVVATVAGPNGEPVPVELDRKGRVCMHGDGSIVPWTDPDVIKAKQVEELHAREKAVSKVLPALPIFTALQMGAWVALFILMLYMNRPGLMASAVDNPALGPSKETLLSYGAKYRGLVVGPEKEIWRLVTPLWVNGGLVQLVPSLLVLWWVGIPLEVSMGTLPFAALYMAIGIFAVVLSTAVSTVPGGAAASGPLVGLLAAMLPLALLPVKARSGEQPEGGVPASACSTSLVSILLWCAAMAVFFGSGILPFIDNAAHVGGAIAGLLLGTVHVARCALRSLDTSSGPGTSQSGLGVEEAQREEAEKSLRVRRLRVLAVTALVLFVFFFALSVVALGFHWDIGLAGTCPACSVFECLQFEGGWTCPVAERAATASTGNTTAAA